MPRIPVVDVVGTVMIQEECLGDCSFRITRLARRTVKSYSPRLVVETVGSLVGDQGDKAHRPGHRGIWRELVQ